jgi:hypothetical protein
MVLKLEEAQLLHARLAKLSFEELEKEFDAKLQEQNEMKFEISAELKSSILEFLQEPTMINAAYNQAGPFVKLSDKVEAGEDLSVLEVRTLQKFIVESKFSTKAHAQLIHNLLTAMQPMNEKLGRLEETARAISEYLQKAETAKNTGLDYSEEDAENNAKLAAQNSKLSEKKAPKAKASKKKEVKAKMEVKK